MSAAFRFGYEVRVSVETGASRELECASSFALRRALFHHARPIDERTPLRGHQVLARHCVARVGGPPAASSTQLPFVDRWPCRTYGIGARVSRERDRLQRKASMLGRLRVRLPSFSRAQSSD